MTKPDDAKPGRSLARGSKDEGQARYDKLVADAFWRVPPHVQASVFEEARPEWAQPGPLAPMLPTARDIRTLHRVILAEGMVLGLALAGIALALWVRMDGPARLCAGLLP